MVVFLSSRRRQTRCALVTGVQTCALPICARELSQQLPQTCPSETLAGEPLAQHVELIERRIAHAQPPAGAVMRNLDAKPQAVGQLPLEQIGRASGRERVCPYV